MTAEIWTDRVAAALDRPVVSVTVKLSVRLAPLGLSLLLA
ncbi:hypothetical protein X805_39870 [Sphaerotilus natans subsp. natans DSM 6575]|uniref:Uncharacterized protein n=1 Tax=Sphaerotilus natans subsp. natans DSM 6575 TaxID=1286631 RepID=A0A059KH38_9BURK|nr:hypothetical protein X805_39870 [Sphaerotilus natans subsp. natans DSM 6575]